MRVLLALALVLPGVAAADVIVATSRVTTVTIYPQGAEVTREVAFEAPAGAHEVWVLDLPSRVGGGMVPHPIRVTSPDTALGAFALRDDRLPPREDVQAPDILLAEEAVKAAGVTLQRAEAKVAGIRAEIEAQEAQIKFLAGVKMNDAAATAEALAAVSAMIGTEVLTARMAALAAGAALPAAEDALFEAEGSLADAEAALEALSQRDEDYRALSVTVTGTGAEGHLVVSYFVSEAGWGPVYDITLDRMAGTLAVKRGVEVGQYSGEDWSGVYLTLSTARPSSQSQPTEFWPWLMRVEDPVTAEEMARMGEGGAGGVVEPMMEPVLGEVTSAVARYDGDTVVYVYPSPVDLASEVEALRLALDDLSFPAEVTARAVPRFDETAFMMATLKNDSTEILLPGAASLYRDGALIGRIDLEAVAPGDETDLGFGAIEGIRLRRDEPQRAEGDRGIISTSTQIEEKAVLQVENLTDEAWPVRVLDQVPYSEQEDLEITWVAEPGVSEENVEGKRGVLAWDFDLAPGEKKEITLESLMSWPEGKVLQ